MGCSQSLKLARPEARVETTNADISRVPISTKLDGFGKLIVKSRDTEAAVKMIASEEL